MAPSEIRVIKFPGLPRAPAGRSTRRSTVAMEQSIKIVLIRVPTLAVSPFGWLLPEGVPSAATLCTNEGDQQPAAGHYK